MGTNEKKPKCVCSNSKGHLCSFCKLMKGNGGTRPFLTIPASLDMIVKYVA